jgi:hypothetical protein
VRAGVDIQDVVRILNGASSGPESNRFWCGDEVDDRLPEGYDPELLSQTWIQQREIALLTVRFCLDEWINSGLRKDGSEAARWRSLKLAPVASGVARAYWDNSGIRQEDDLTLRLLPPRRAAFGFDYAEWKGHRAVALILASDLRLLIAKCRYPECKHPYFLLDKKQIKRIYKDGIFCHIRSHRRIVAAARHIAKYRKETDEWLCVAAAKYLRDKNAPMGWNANRVFKSALALHLERIYDKNKSIPHTRTTIKANWVTRHWKEIERQRRGLHATSPKDGFAKSRH